MSLAATSAATSPAAKQASEPPASPRECRSAEWVLWKQELAIPAGPTCAARKEWLASSIGRDACVLGSRPTAGIPGKLAVSRERRHDDAWVIWAFQCCEWVHWTILRVVLEWFWEEA